LKKRRFAYLQNGVFLFAFLYRHPDAGETKTTSKCCFWTTGEDHLMSRNGSDGEFSGRVTEASVSEARSQDLVKNRHRLCVEGDAETSSA
jgi:hypothetical protein